MTNLRFLFSLGLLLASIHSVGCSGSNQNSVRKNKLQRHRKWIKKSPRENPACNDPTDKSSSDAPSGRTLLGICWDSKWTAHGMCLLL